MTLNYLGKYDDLSLLWEAHPNGGIEGEYCYVGDQLLVWNKYSNDWIEGSVEELDAIPAEQSEPESNNGLNYIGRFKSEQELWSQYPQGGVEGDYVVIADKEYIWDKYNKEWREATEEDAIRFATVIMQDSEYEYSRLAVTFMGSFEDISQIWKVYPQGGIEGGYIYLGEDKYIWDKYTYSWKPFEPTESSKLRPIEVTYTEGVVGYSEDYINYIGTFDNLDQVWEMYPNGGKDGDYILVNGERLKWNKYTSNWGEDESGETTPARSVATVYGDLHVFNDLVIGDELYARILEELSKKQWVQDNFTSKQWLLDQNYARQEWVLDQYGILQDWVDRRNADIAEWILERGYISEEDISSETVMNLIETDEITISKKGGVLASIATGGQGSVPIITTEDTESVPSDKNVFSAARVASTFLDTTLGGSVLEPVNFEKGIRIGGEAGIDLTYDSDNGALRLGGNAYSLGGLTAGGVGSGTSGGGSSYDRLDSWNDYAPEKVLSALLGKQMYDRIGTIESAGYALTSDLANYQPLATAINTSNIGSQSVAYATNAGSANNANALGGQVPAYYATASALNSLTTEVVAFRALFDELFEKDSANNAIHAKLALWSSGGITAGGVGSGSSGGGGGISYNRLDAWADYSADKSDWVLSALLGKDLDNRVSALSNAGYVTQSGLAPYALRSEIPSLAGYATEAWVQSQGYAIASALDNYLSLTGGIMAKNSYIDWGNTDGFEDYSAYSGGFKILGYNAGSGNYRGGIHVGVRYGWQLTRDASSEVFQIRNYSPSSASWGDWKTLAFTDSNVASATKLATPRTIWGQSFDGTGNISGNLSSDAWRIITDNSTQGVFVQAKLVDGTSDAGRVFITGHNGASLSLFNIWSATTRIKGNVGIGIDYPSEALHVHGNGKFTGTLTSPAITTNSLTIGGVTLTYDSVNEALCINGNMYALGGITAGGAGISAYTSLEARVARLEQQLNI